MNIPTKHSLRTVIDEWINAAQEDDSLKMWISCTLVDSMAEAAWVVLRESRKTQQWMEDEGVLEELAGAQKEESKK